MRAWWRRAPSAAADPKPDLSRARPGWQHLAPLQRTVGPVEPTAPLDSFASSLASGHDPRFLAPLEHVVDANGPSGRAEGIATPVPPKWVTGGPELALRPGQQPVQRATASGAVQTESAAAPIHDRAVPVNAGPIPAGAARTPTPSRHIHVIPEPDAEPELTTAPDPGLTSTLPVVARATVRSPTSIPDAAPAESERALPSASGPTAAPAVIEPGRSMVVEEAKAAAPRPLPVRVQRVAVSDRHPPDQPMRVGSSSGASEASTQPPQASAQVSSLPDVPVPTQPAPPSLPTAERGSEPAAEERDPPSNGEPGLQPSVAPPVIVVPTTTGASSVERLVVTGPTSASLTAVDLSPPATPAVRTREGPPSVAALTLARHPSTTEDPTIMKFRGASSAANAPNRATDLHDRREVGESAAGAPVEGTAQPVVARTVVASADPEDGPAPIAALALPPRMPGPGSAPVGAPHASAEPLGPSPTRVNAPPTELPMAGAEPTGAHPVGLGAPLVSGVSLQGGNVDSAPAGSAGPGWEPLTTPIVGMSPQSDLLGMDARFGVAEAAATGAPSGWEAVPPVELGQAAAARSGDPMPGPQSLGSTTVQRSTADAELSIDLPMPLSPSHPSPHGSGVPAEPPHQTEPALPPAAPLLGMGVRRAFSTQSPPAGSRPGTTPAWPPSSPMPVQRLAMPTRPIGSPRLVDRPRFDGAARDLPAVEAGLGPPLPPSAPVPLPSSGVTRDVVRVLPLQRMFDPGAAAVAAGIARADGPGSVVFDPPPGSDPRASAGEPSVQRQDDAAPATPSSAVVASAAAPPPTPGTPALDLDDLARRLIEPLSARLKTELWLDRERAGIVTDLRR